MTLHTIAKLAGGSSNLLGARLFFRSIQRKQALVPLQKFQGASEFELEVKGSDDCHFQVEDDAACDSELLSFGNKRNDAFTRWLSGLSNLGTYEKSSNCQDHQVRGTLFSSCEVSEVSVGDVPGVVHGLWSVSPLLGVQDLDVQRHHISLVGLEQEGVASAQVVPNSLVLVLKHAEVAELGVLGCKLAVLFRLVVFQVHVWQCMTV